MPSPRSSLRALQRDSTAMPFFPTLPPCSTLPRSDEDILMRQPMEGTITRLHLMRMEPHHATHVGVALARLRRIEYVRVRSTVDRDGKTFFVMDVAHHRQRSRLPVPSATPAVVIASAATHADATVATSAPSSLCARLRRLGSGSFRAPAYEVEASFSRFAALRRDVALLLCTNSRFTCAYCTEFERYIRFRLRQPRWIVKIGTRKEQRKTILQDFINDFVRMAQLRVQHCVKCRACERVPFLVDEFLRQEAMATDA